MEIEGAALQEKRAVAARYTVLQDLDPVWSRALAGNLTPAKYLDEPTADLPAAVRGWALNRPGFSGG